MYTEYLNEDSILVVHFVVKDGQSSGILTWNNGAMGELSSKFYSGISLNYDRILRSGDKIYFINQVRNQSNNQFESEIILYDLNFNIVCQYPIGTGYDSDNALTRINQRVYVSKTNSNELQLYRIDDCTGLEALTIDDNAEKIKDFEVYPNPTSGNLTVTIEPQLIGTFAEIVNPLGTVVQSLPLKQVNELIELQNSGIYFIRIGSQTKKVIIL